MNPSDEAEFTVMTQNMYNNGGTTNVLDCLISMLESQLIILKKLKDMKEKNNG
jgi:hypothetical protein